MAFPSDGNFCYKAYPAERISRAHQSGYCLSGRYSACPVFLARAGAPLPAALAAAQSRREPLWKKVNTAIILVAALVFSLAGNWFSGSAVGDRLMALINSPSLFEQPEPGLEPLVSSPTPLPTQSHFTGNLFRSPEPEPPAATECPLPQGWEVYTIQPTDSIFRLSTLYGVSVEDLQKYNCLGSQTILSPGSTLYVPAPERVTMPTSTTWPTPVPLPVTVNEAVEVEKSSGDDDPPEVIQPTPVPPTEEPVEEPDNPDPTPGDSGDGDEGDDNGGDDADDDGDDDGEGNDDDDSGGDDGDDNGDDHGGDDGDDDDDDDDDDGDD